MISALRGFSAPVNLTSDAPAKDAYVLLAADPDLFNRWEAGQGLARDLILKRVAGRADEVGEERFAEAMGRALTISRPILHSKRCWCACRANRTWPWPRSPPIPPPSMRRARRCVRAWRCIWAKPCAGCTAGCKMRDILRLTPRRPAAGRCETPRWNLLVADRHALNAERARGHFEAAGQHDRLHRRAYRP